MKTDIPNPGNKPKLIMMENKIALIHTPNASAGFENRNPLSLWISSDDMKTWEMRIELTDFPGAYCYCDGLYENEHILFTIEHNRHTIFFFDIELED